MSNSLAASILAKVTVTTALALAGARLARRSRAAVRYAVLAAAFVVLLALPIAAVVAPSIPVAVPIAAEETPAPATAEPVIDVAAPTAAADIAGEGAPAVPYAVALSASAIVLTGWGAGAALFLLPMVVGLWRMRSLRRSGVPWRQGRSVVELLARDAGIHRRIEVLLHEFLAGPMTCGIVRPTVVLPTDAQDWAAEDLRRALVHELEHVRRGDWASQCVARALCALYWFHPLVWIARRQLVLEAERACDDAVLRRAQVDATEYADQLIGLAERLSSAGHPPLLAMANRHDLATRVGAVLDSRQARGRAGAFAVVIVGAASALLVTTMSPLRMVAEARPGAQATASSTATPVISPARQKFDAATIKPCVAEENPTGARGTAGGTNATFSPGRFFVPCVTTEQLIYLAYASYGAPESDHLVNDDPGSASNAVKIRGGPAWVHSLRDKYSIEAVAAGATERTVLMGSMLRSLLEDRFHLQLHRDTEEVALYALTVAKGGFKLKPMKDGDCEDYDGPPPAGPPDLKTVNAAKPKCGSVMMLGSETTKWTFGGFQISSLAGQLSHTLGMHVVDKTGITDKFVFRFEFKRDPDALATEANVMTSLGDQLGLKLEKTKGPRGYLVIDAIERPSPNGPTPVAAPARAAGAGAGRV